MSVGCRRPKNSAVFTSGAGSTLQALLELQHQFPVRLVVSNKKNALGLLKAKRFGVPVFHFGATTSFKELSNILQGLKIDRIFLAGFMRILPPDFVQQWKGSIFNIHPSLLPDFPGLHAAEKSFQNQKRMGVTIHEVTSELDRGQIFLQKNSIGSDYLKSLNLSQSLIFLRRTEQHLLREFAFRRGL